MLFIAKKFSPVLSFSRFLPEILYWESLPERKKMKFRTLEESVSFVGAELADNDSIFTESVPAFISKLSINLVVLLTVRNSLLKGFLLKMVDD